MTDSCENRIARVLNEAYGGWRPAMKVSWESLGADRQQELLHQARAVLGELRHWHPLPAPPPPERIKNQIDEYIICDECREGRHEKSPMRLGVGWTKDEGLQVWCHHHGSVLTLKAAPSAPVGASIIITSVGST